MISHATFQNIMFQNENCTLYLESYSGPPQDLYALTQSLNLRKKLFDQPLCEN